VPVLRYVIAILFVIGGILHFINTDLYLKIMPPYIPWHLAMVYISGVAEIAGGVGLLVPVLRKPAAWGLVALLIAVFPANVYMAMDRIQVTSRPIPQALLWARLPLQAVMIWLVLFVRKQWVRKQ
jgi:uncharacterized membrane protein